jgi:osmotically-inducible protein OsmY
MSASKVKRFEYQDDKVMQRVSNFLGSLHFPAFRNLDVSVSNGTVTLTGKVCSYYEKQVAITSCQHVVGVVSLIDQIVVSDFEVTEFEMDETQRVSAPSRIV